VGQFPLLTLNHYKFSVNLSGHVADLVGFLDPHLSGTLYMYLLGGETDLLNCLRPLWLTRVIALVLVLQHSIEKCLMVYYIYSNKHPTSN